jgi:DNA-directed RNA polymerase specialized sigma24 family protein
MAWLIGVAFRVLSNQRRTSSRRTRLVEKASRDRAWAPLPDEQLLRHEEDREMLDALARLSPADRGGDGGSGLTGWPAVI